MDLFGFAFNAKRREQINSSQQFYYVKSLANWPPCQTFVGLIANFVHVTEEGLYFARDNISLELIGARGIPGTSFSQINSQQPICWSEHLRWSVLSFSLYPGDKSPQYLLNEVIEGKWNKLHYPPFVIAWLLRVLSMMWEWVVFVLLQDIVTWSESAQLNHFPHCQPLPAVTSNSNSTRCTWVWGLRRKKSDNYECPRKAGARERKDKSLACQFAGKLCLGFYQIINSLPQQNRPFS